MTKQRNSKKRRKNFLKKTTNKSSNKSKKSKRVNKPLRKKTKHLKKNTNTYQFGESTTTSLSKKNQEHDELLYQFIILKNYPRSRRFLILKPLKTSIFDKIKELLSNK